MVLAGAGDGAGELEREGNARRYPALVPRPPPPARTVASLSLLWEGVLHVSSLGSVEGARRGGGAFGESAAQIFGGRPAERRV